MKKGRRKSDPHRRTWKKLDYKKIHALRQRYAQYMNWFKKKGVVKDKLSEEFDVSVWTIDKILAGETHWGDGSLNDSERLFKSKVLKFLKGLGPNVWFIKNDQRAMRGVPDVLACLNGSFVAIELKGSRKKLLGGSNKSTKLQMFELVKIDKAGGYAAMAFPENWDSIKEELTHIYKGDSDDSNKCRELAKIRLRHWSNKAARLSGVHPKTGLPYRPGDSEDRERTEGSSDDVQQIGEQVLRED